MPKVLIIGPKLADFDPGYNQAIARAFSSLGFEYKVISFFEPSPTGFFSRILIDGLVLLGIKFFYDRYVSRFNRDLVESYFEYKPDIVFVVKGSKINSETVRQMSSSFNILWCYDLARRSGIDAIRAQAYNKVYCFEKSDADWVTKHYLVDAGYLPMGFDPSTFFYRKMEKDIDVFFVGAYYPQRRQFLEKLVNTLPEVKFVFYGRHLRYKEPSSWLSAIKYLLSGKSSIFVNRSLNANEVCSFYNRSKICLNMHHNQSKDSCNPRVYEISGTQNFQLVDNIPHFKKYNLNFISKYHNFDDAVDKIRSSLANNSYRESQAESAYKWAISHHSFQSRIASVLRELSSNASATMRNE